jgi:uncharacterized protein (TIRG00374 family)
VLVDDRQATRESAERLTTREQSTPTQRRRTRLALNLVAVVVTLALSYVAFRGIDFSIAWHGLRTSDLWWLLAAVAAFALGNLARSLRWRSLFIRGRRPPLRPIANAMMVGYLYNNILPARAGEAARVVVLAQRSSTPPTEIVATVLLERLYDVIGILVIFFAAEPWMPQVSWFKDAALAALALSALIAASAAVLAIHGDRPVRLLLSPLRRLPLLSDARIEQTVSELTHGLSGLRHRGTALEALLWTIAAWMLTALCAYLVSLAFHLQLSPSCGVLVAVAVGLGMIIPSPPAAVGVFEAAALIALKTYGIPHSSALPYALALHIVNFVPFVIVGGFLIHYNTRHPRYGPQSTP